MSLVEQIRADLIDEAASLPNTLRKAKVLASTIGSPEFREWVNYELEGYPTDDNIIPSYRRHKATNLGEFSGPFQSGVKNVVLPLYGLPEEVQEFAREAVFAHGVRELEGMLEQDGLQRKWPQEMLWLARDEIKMTGDMKLIDAHQPIPKYVISGILDNVKNRLLDFMIGLEESEIDPETFERTDPEKEAVRNLVQVHIIGDHNTVASGENIRQEVSTVRKGDADSLLEYLRSIHVEDDDLEEIKEALSLETTMDAAGGFGPQIRAWIGKMVMKATNGTWKVSAGTASFLLARALSQYYGQS